MDQKHWEERLDRTAERVSRAVADGVHVLEDAYEKGKETLKDEMNTRPGTTTTGASMADPIESAPDVKPVTRGSRRLGLVLVGLGIIWLLHTLSILDQPGFPILLIVLGVYFIARSK